MPAAPRRWIAHLDMDAFYASVELLRYPELVDQPVVIGGGRRHQPRPRADGSREFSTLHDYKGRGVITTATYPARDLGVHSGMGLMKAALLAPQATLISALAQGVIGGNLEWRMIGIGALVAFVYSVAAFAQVLMGTLMSRFDMKHLMIGVGLAQIPLLFAAATLDGWPMLVVALLMMMAIFGQIPLNDGIVGRYVADEYRARVLSVRYVVSLGVASIAVPMIALLHRTQGGFRNVFLVLAALAVAVFISALFFPSRERIRQAPSAAATT